MKVIIFLLLSVVGVFAQAPLKGTNLWLTTPPVQSTAGSIARFLTLSTAGVGETVTPTKLWDAVVLTGTVDTTDIGGFSALGRNLVDDVTTGDMQTTLGANTVGKSLFTLTNPSAITFLRVNADNTVTARTVTETKTDLSLGNVDNTSDANKPVSTAAQTALNLKANITGPQTYVSSHTFDHLFAQDSFASVNGGGFGGDNINKGVVFDAYGTGGLVTFSTHETIASATTIAPLKQVVVVSGTAAITTITAPGAFIVTGTTCGQITIIPTGAFTTTTSGNIALSTTAVVGKALIMTYLNSAGKWYPSY